MMNPKIDSRNDRGCLDKCPCRVVLNCIASWDEGGIVNVDDPASAQIARDALIDVEVRQRAIRALPASIYYDHIAGMISENV